MTGAASIGYSQCAVTSSQNHTSAGVGFDKYDPSCLQYLSNCHDGFPMRHPLLEFKKPHSLLRDSGLVGKLQLRPRDQAAGSS